jgi:thiamine kinase-like enzyme
MKIDGHSNFKIKLEKLNSNIVITKSSSSEDFNRLSKQMIKQEEFFNKYSKKFKTSTPKIIKNKDNKFYMEYIYFSENFIDFIVKGNIRKTNCFLTKIFNIIENFLQECNYEYLKKGILKNKIDSVKKNLSKNKYVNFENSFIQKDLNIKIPLGICHGDLTFSNILIDCSNMNLYLIDFLDSFIESPILDIVKIRQDTKFYWVCNMYSDNFDKNSVILTLNYMDKEVEKYFAKYDFFNKTYKFFEKLNILRVLQYSKNDSININHFL